MDIYFAFWEKKHIGHSNMILELRCLAKGKQNKCSHFAQRTQENINYMWKKNLSCQLFSHYKTAPTLKACRLPKRYMSAITLETRISMRPNQSTTTKVKL